MKYFTVLLTYLFFTHLYGIDFFYNQVGYEETLLKKIVIRNNTPLNEKTFNVLDLNNNVILTGNLKEIGQIAQWDNYYYYVAEIKSTSLHGEYYLQTNNEKCKITIIDGLLFEKTAPLVINFFYSMRNTMEEDKNLTYYGGRTGTHNCYGGWDDASGDHGKYLSHLSFANYFNPQQIPLVVWSLLYGYELNKDYYEINGIKIKEEAAWGLDYLLRVLDPEGYFYITIFDGWGYNPPRQICAWEGSEGTKTADYQSAFREGGGMAIAALAKAYYMGIEGDSTKEQYLKGAIKAYNHIKNNNTKYCDDGKENIIDDYTALMAAVELYKATQNEEYLSDAKKRVNRILQKQSSEGFLYSDDELQRPFYHAADEGLVALALFQFLTIDNSLQQEIVNFINKLNDWYINISFQDKNPFGYVKMYYKLLNSSQTKIAYFMPHENETGYWWQGENARIASMSSQFLLSFINSPLGTNTSDSALLDLALSQINWILGENPYGICMMYGIGEKNYPAYVNDRIEIGGICNGITSKEYEETGYEFMPYPASDWHNWRWIEQWLPHDAWYFIAINLLNYAITNNKLNKIKTTKQTIKDIELKISPNPFNPLTNIIVNSSKAKIYIYDINGNLVKSLSGKLIYNFKASEYASGMFFIKAIYPNNKVITKKAILLK